MRFQHCPECGLALTAREIGDEGLVPWCERCERPWFDMFPCCVISLVHNGAGRVLLLHQSYIHPTYMNLVSGYIIPGESAEQAAIREIKEETGLVVERLEMVGTWWFERKQMLMIGFLAKCDDKTPVILSEEVDSAAWFDADEAVGRVHPQGSVSYALADIYKKRGNSTKL
ncbi:MAG: NUDIX domain-containing protein [Muribaculum sp.]|nr:NUDIX domain-containing protein [Muribaculaceae bacterium]MCM1080453.1 NUDIX domain-containing protein [Muribaculum sp.]